MNYTYDILLNFNEKIFDFYDWNKGDNIKHIKKIPIFKIDSISFKNLKENDVEFDQQFLEKIYNKTEEFTQRKNKTLEYACLFTEGNEILGLNINNKKTTYSRLLLDEEIEILDITTRLEQKDIKFDIVNRHNIDEFKTRKEIEQTNMAKKELKNLLVENNFEKLKYLYYECFDKKIDSIDEIIKTFNHKIEDKNIIEKINNFINIKNV